MLIRIDMKQAGN